MRSSVACAVGIASLFVALQPAAMSAEAQSGTSETGKTAKATASAKPVRPGVGIPLTEDEIASLKEAWEEGGKKFHFEATFKQKKLDEREKKKALKSGKIPFVVTASLFEMKEINGKVASVPRTDSVNIYILDAKGEIVQKKGPTSLQNIAPKGRDGGGYSDEVPTSGVYRAVIWVDHKKGSRLGTTITTELSASE